MCDYTFSERVYVARVRACVCVCVCVCCVVVNARVARVRACANPLKYVQYRSNDFFGMMSDVTLTDFPSFLLNNVRILTSDVILNDFTKTLQRSETSQINDFYRYVLVIN